MIKEISIIILLILSSVGTLGVFDYSYKTKSLAINDKNSYFLNKGIDSTKSNIIYGSLNNSADLNISLNDIFKKISDFEAEYGGFRIKESDYDSAINATYWGTLAVYILGKLSSFISDHKLLDFLNYTYDESSGGFRFYLDSNVSIEATSYGVFLIELVQRKLDFFNITKTTKFLESELNKSISENNLELLSFSLSIIALSYLNSSALDYEKFTNIIMSFYKDGLFYDDASKAKRLLQTYFAIKALRVLNRSLLDIRDEIKDAVLSLFQTINNTYGGFGEGNITTFETFLALDILYEINYLDLINATLIKAYINKIYSKGIFYDDLKRREFNIFSESAGVLLLYILGELKNYTKVSIRLEYGNQIPIDLNETKVFVKISLNDTILNNLIVSTNLSNILEFNESIGEYIGLVNLSGLDFGIHWLEVIYYYKFNILPKIIGSDYLEFRVGYSIKVISSGKVFTPGDKISLNVTVSFYNGTLISSGNLNITLYKEKFPALFTATYSLNGSIVQTIISIPTRVYLGYYRLLVYVIDLHGSNHTVFLDRILIRDSLVTSFINGNKTVYHIGEKVELNVTVLLNSTKEPIPETNITIYFGDYLAVNQNVYWVNQSLISLKTSLPNIVPDKERIDFILLINWDNEYSSRLSLFTFNVSLEDLVFEYLGARRLELGDNITLNVTLIANYTGKVVENSSLTFSIIGDNESYLETELKYNDTLGYYISEIYVDPNIPQGDYNVSIKMFVPWNDSTVEILSKNKFVLEIVGVLALNNSSIIINPSEIYVGDIVTVTFSVINVNINRSVYGLNMFANITIGEKFEVTSIGEADGVYQLTFEAKYSGEYLVQIMRFSDNSTIGEISILVKSVGGPSIYQILEPYISGLLWSISAIVTILYLFTRYYFGKRVSRRYLVRKARKRKR